MRLVVYGPVEGKTENEGGYKEEWALVLAVGALFLLAESCG